jgi:hypothetical protein
MRILGTLALALALAGATTTAAHADASCTTLVTNINNTLVQSGGYYDFEMTMHRTSISTVSYSSGYLQRTGNASWPLSGSSNQLFADRRAGNQPFNINASDTLTPWISPTGSLYIYYNTWSFSTQWDMQCTGNTMTRIIPGFGVVSLTLRAWHPPIG